jgi:hypothetical protein
MMQGVAKLVASQESANYGPNYHGLSDTFEKVDQRQLRLNAAIAAATSWGFAESEASFPHQTGAEVESLIQSTELGAPMRSFGLWEAWVDGTRGRR